MDAHEALFLALVGLAMAADAVKQQLAWDQFSAPMLLQAWAIQPPCLDMSAAIGCVLALGD